MDNLNKVDVQHPASATIHKLNEHAATHKIVFSSDFKLHRTTDGTHIGIKQSAKSRWESVSYRGELDTTSSYDVNEVVNVYSGSAYTITGSAISASVGTWVCVVPVPSFNYSSSNQNEVRQAGTNYAPINPFPSSLANPWATDGTQNGRYWEPFGAPVAAVSPWKGNFDASVTYQYGDIVDNQGGQYSGIWVYDSHTPSSGSLPDIAAGPWHHFNWGSIDTPACGGKTQYVNMSPPL